MYGKISSTLTLLLSSVESTVGDRINCKHSSHCERYFRLVMELSRTATVLMSKNCDSKLTVHNVGSLKNKGTFSVFSQLDVSDIMLNL